MRLWCHSCTLRKGDLQMVVQMVHYTCHSHPVHMGFLWSADSQPASWSKLQCVISCEQAKNTEANRFRGVSCDSSHFGCLGCLCVQLSL